MIEVYKNKSIGNKNCFPQNFSSKKEEKLFKEGAKSHIQGMWSHTLHIRLQKIRGFYNPPVKAEQSSFLEWNKKVVGEEK